MTPWEIAGVALAVLVVITGFLWHLYMVPWWWWPLIGTEWRAERRGDYDEDVHDLRQTWQATEDGPDEGIPAVGASDLLDELAGASDRSEQVADDEWVQQLHVINLDAHRDRPIAQLTHYEVEAVIHDLGVAEWVPQRYRAAA